MLRSGVARSSNIMFLRKIDGKSKAAISTTKSANPDNQVQNTD
jgi:hypothetical protein